MQERARMDRIRADAYHAAQASVRDEKGKGKATERIALNGIEDDFRLPLLLLILKLIMLGNRLEQNKIMDRTGEQEWTGYANPNRSDEVGKERKGRLCTNGIEDEYVFSYVDIET